MPANYVRQLLAEDVRTGRRREVPWRELASLHFAANTEMESWQLFREWAAKNGIGWRLTPEGGLRNGWLVFQSSDDERHFHKD